MDMYVEFVIPFEATHKLCKTRYVSLEDVYVENYSILTIYMFLVFKRIECSQP